MSAAALDLATPEGMEWLDHMPEMDCPPGSILRRGDLVVQALHAPHGRYRVSSIYTGVVESGKGYAYQSGWRLALCDPRGMAHVLLEVPAYCGYDVMPLPRWRELLDRWAIGGNTDADRLYVAKRFQAIAEVL